MFLVSRWVSVIDTVSSSVVPIPKDECIDNSYRSEGTCLPPGLALLTGRASFSG